MNTKRDKARSKKRLHSIAIRIDDEMRDELRAMAEEQARPMANLIVFALKEWLAAQKQKPTK